MILKVLRDLREGISVMKGNLWMHFEGKAKKRKVLIMRRKILWKENTTGRKILWQGKYHEEQNVKRERKYYEELCDENGLPEWNWNKT